MQDANDRRIENALRDAKREARHAAEDLADAAHDLGRNVKHAAEDLEDEVKDDVETRRSGNRLPEIQTGGRAIDGSPDTRGVTEKIADAVTGDRVDDKTGKRVR